MQNLTRRGWMFAVALASTRWRSAFAATDHFVVIVHPDNPVASIDRDFLRDAFLKKATDWSHGETIRPIDLSGRFGVRDVFTREVLHKTAAQLRSYWNQQIFSGKGTPPVEADSMVEMIDYVVANAGAVGYLPSGTAPGRAKVVEVK
ncbi:MAG: substrate-binding domain-containing protein [Deltaproteobacteria bacterium]